MLREIISVGLIFIGTAFILISALGVVRMPDLYLRMSSSTKASTLGVGAMLLGAAVYFNELGVTSRAIATIIFVLLTAPVAAHMMGRAAYFNGVPLWEKTAYDELRGRYNTQTHTLRGTNGLITAESEPEESIRPPGTPLT
jgi:multicomponent Na+:H+ antiporter subunit G